jgi:hypothetical protein
MTFGEIITIWPIIQQIGLYIELIKERIFG